MLSLVLAVALSAATDAPVTHVTVFSDRARVTRTLDVTGSATQTVELPLLQESVDPNSVRVESTGPEVRRVDIQNVNEDEFPTDEAKKLLAQLRSVEDQLAKARGDKAADEAQVALLGRIRPLTPQPEPQRNVPKLNAAGWAAAVAFASTETQKLQDKSRALDKQISTLEDEYQELTEKAQLMGGVGKRRGLKVTATVAGAGKLTLTYVTSRARWYPLYELQLLPDTGKVQISFSGRVSQETGEDWNDAQLVLSTAVPLNVTVLPKLPTWKIGEKERFIPTPYPVSEQVRPPPPAPPLPVVTKWEDVVRQRLLAEVGQVGPQRVNLSGNGYGYASHVGGKAEAKKQAPSMPYEQPVVNEPQAVMEDQDLELEEKKPMAPPPPPKVDAREVPAGEEVAVASAPSRGFFDSGKDQKEAEFTQGVSLMPPRGWIPPSPPPDSPAALAGGYDLSFPSLRPETIASGKGMRRVPLFTEQWPVTVERKLFPAVAKEAYLVAEIKSPSKQVLPAGNANLFVGEDPAGNARVPLVSPGEAFTLPLGLDRAIKPVRNVKVSQAEKGFIGKDEITEYVVTTEISNPYSVPIATRIMDQWPVTSNKDLKIELLKTEPWAIQDKVKGTLEWRITIPPRGKQVVTFVYTLRRPKGWLLYQ
ncbi:MAG: DUF4139 domain-containing protein [Myxococcaceae bacterium]